LGFDVGFGVGVLFTKPVLKRVGLGVIDKPFATSEVADGLLDGAKVGENEEIFEVGRLKELF